MSRGAKGSKAIRVSRGRFESTMTCPNPNCRHRTKRRLRPLVISLAPPGGDGGGSRRERIARMFATHPSLSRHFEPPAFSPGVPQRDLRNRLRLLEHGRRAGLIPEVEWEAICRAVREHGAEEDDAHAPRDDGKRGFTFSEASASSYSLDPFKYLATTTKIQPNNDDDNDAIDKFAAPSKDAKKSKRNNKWLDHRTTSLVPISSERKGSREDRALPYSMELWRKAKTLNRDRSVLACTLAHLLAMKKLVGEEREDTHGVDGGDNGFDFILEDNVRAFVGVENEEICRSESANGTDEKEWTGWGCECANRIWDIIEASRDVPSQCHMRYYGWLGSAPNLNWIYSNHIARSAFNVGASLSGPGKRDGAVLFPYPTNEDFEQDERTEPIVDASVEQLNSADASFQSPQFTTPGGTAVWGTFAYTISSASHRTLINQLKNDVGSMVWKGKRMRAYRAKPIDKILPRHVFNQYGSESVHLPEKVAFVRCPMLGSLLHPQWEEGFCNSTELQHRMSRRCWEADSSTDSNSANTDGSEVWDSVWLTDEEMRVVNYRRRRGKWVQSGDVAHASDDEPGCGWSQKSAATSTRVITTAILVTIISLSFSTFAESLLVTVIPTNAFAHAFSFDITFRLQYNQENHFLLRSSTRDDDVTADLERKREKLGKVPIISRRIPIEINLPLDSPNIKHAAKSGAITEGGTQRLDVTVWEMDKPSELMQEWWSIDEAERSARVGDPFGVVMWPGSILASKELMKQHFSSLDSPITNSTVLVLGAGTGVEAQTAALLGARRVVATDINPLTLKLLEHGAKKDERIVDCFEAKYFDMFSSEALPPCDIILAADVLYNPELAKQVGKRLHEAIVRSFDEGKPPTKVVVTDSQKFHGTNFLEEVAELRELNAMFRESNWKELKWVSRTLENVCGSGVMIDEDQVYDVEVRMICWGWQL